MISFFLIMVFNETSKSLNVMWRYKFNLLAQLSMFVFLFIGISFLMGEGDIDPEVMGPTMVGFMVWFYAFGAISNISLSLMSEAKIGTLEQVYMSPSPIELILFGRIFASFLTTSISAMVLAACFYFLLGVYLTLAWDSILVFIITIAGVFGFGFMLGGLTLAYKRVSAFGNIIQNMLLFMNGTLLPVDRFPEWMIWISKTLPTTQGIVVLRTIMIEDATLYSCLMDGSLIELILHSSAYLFAGWVIFRWGERFAMRKGTLGQY
jgi:ABC-2 type transport system permease protein